jgi:hypothetical protein
MLDIITRVATINTQQGLAYLIPLFGYTTEVRNPTRSDSMYNPEAAEFNYPATADFSVDIVYANLMDMSRLQSVSLIDPYAINPIGYTADCRIMDKARLTFTYSIMVYQLEVERVTVLDESNADLGPGVLKLTLVPYI